MAAARRGVSLVERLEAFAKRLHLEPAAVDMNRLLTSAVREAQQILGPMDARLALPPVAPVAHADAARLQEALSSLIVRIVRAFEGGAGVIRLECGRIYAPADAALLARPNPCVRMTLRCTGEGARPELVSAGFRAPYATGQTSWRPGWELASIAGFFRQSSGRLVVAACSEHEIVIDLHLPAVA